MVSGGAPLNPTSAVFQAMGLPMLQGYGQTRRDPSSAATGQRPESAWKRRAAADEHEVRIAEDGEILVRGENVMHGYWRNPEETARVLHDGWLHTGDVGHLDKKADRHHRSQEGSDRPRQGRQRLAAAGRGDAEAPAGNRPGDGHVTATPISSPHRARAEFADAPDLQHRLSQAVDRVNAELSVTEKVRASSSLTPLSRLRTSN